MTNIVFETFTALNEFLKQIPFLGKGNEGSCYLYRDDWTLKIFNENYLEYLANSGKDILAYKNLHIRGFSFAKHLIFVKNELVGVLSPFIKGLNIEESPLVYKPIDDVVVASSALVIGINIITILGIEAFDTWTENIIYHHRTLGVIDTTNFCDFERKKNHLETNFIHVMKPVINSALGLAIIEPKSFYYILQDKIGIKAFLDKTNSRYKNYDEDIDLLQNPGVLLLGIKEELEEFIETPLTTFSDAKEPLQRKLVK